MLLSLLFLACGDKATDTASEPEADTSVEPAFDCTQDYAFCAELSVPSDFQGTPKNLTLALYSSLPPMGPPDVILAQVSSPEIGIGNNYAVELHPITASGDYHLYVSLYMEGGGEWMPASGIDYSLSTDAISFTGSAVDMGELKLILAE